MPSKPFKLTDIAVNLTDSSFAAELEEVVTRANHAGVHRLVVIGSHIEESLAAVELCQRFPGQLISTAGCHPHHAKDWQNRSLEQLSLLLQHPCVKAVGETGLDFNRDFSPRPQQQRVFEAQLELAVTEKMPILMHERDAHQRFDEMLSSYRDQLGNALLHCFTGSREELYRYRDLDLYLGITGWICDERRGLHLRELVREIPLDRLLLETDSPYLLPRSLRPKPKSRRNEPAHLRHICEQVAELLGMTPAALAAQTEANAQRFFGLTDGNQPANEPNPTPQ